MKRRLRIIILKSKENISFVTMVDNDIVLAKNFSTEYFEDKTDDDFANMIFWKVKTTFKNSFDFDIEEETEINFLHV